MSGRLNIWKGGVEIKKVCHICEKEIKKRPLIFDNYYFCNNNNGECKTIHIFGKNNEKEVEKK